MEFFATAAKGTEPALRDELREIRLRRVRADRGGVHFEGTLEDGMRACVTSGVALRVMTPLGAFEAPSGGALYEGVRGVDWSPFLSPKETLVVSAFCRSSALTHSQFVAQKTKDAIVDQIRDQVGARPSVDREDADVHVFVHIVKDRATVYLDLAGESLHRRGYRMEAGEAPLKETLAAAVVRLSGWDRTSQLVDPMCGSGTIAIEAALLSRGIAPGLFRKRFGFERWRNHDEAAKRSIARVREEAKDRVHAEGPSITGSDSDEHAIAAARKNAKAAGVSLRLEQKPASEVSFPAPPFAVVTNPPYGHRIAAGSELESELAGMARRMPGGTLTVLAGSQDVAAAIPFRPDRALVLFNGDIECRLLTYSIFEKKRR
jgi:23S rRNA G2445 N2-methylase RlmL